MTDRICVEWELLPCACNEDRRFYTAYFESNPAKAVGNKSAAKSAAKAVGKLVLDAAARGVTGVEVLWRPGAKVTPNG